MTVAISLRLDDETLRALNQLEASGLSRSEAIRRAIKADEADRQEMLEVAAVMESLRAPG